VVDILGIFYITLLEEVEKAILYQEEWLPEGAELRHFKIRSIDFMRSQYKHYIYVNVDVYYKIGELFATSYECITINKADFEMPLSMIVNEWSRPHSTDQKAEVAAQSTEDMSQLLITAIQEELDKVEDHVPQIPLGFQNLEMVESPEEEPTTGPGVSKSLAELDLDYSSIPIGFRKLEI